MIQPKHSPKEALEKIKLMMKYDTSKTLNENKTVIFEQTVGKGVPSTIGFVVGAIAVAAWVASIPLTAGVTATMAPGISALMLGGAGAGYGLGTFIENWFTDESQGQNEFKNLMKFCVSGQEILESIPRVLSDSEAKEIAYSIEGSKGQWNDDEDLIVNSLKKIGSLSDLCYVNKKVPGGLYGFLDDLTNSPDEWTMFTRPVKDIIEDSQIEVKTTDADCLKTPTLPKCKGKIVIDDGDSTIPPNPNPPNPNPPNPNKTGKFTPCSGTYHIYCSSNVIAKVQGCLGGLVVDGKFGPRTQEVLKSKGYPNGFTDADVSKICKVAPVEPVEPEVGGEELTIDAGNL